MYFNEEHSSMDKPAGIYHKKYSPAKWKWGDVLTLH